MHSSYATVPRGSLPFNTSNVGKLHLPINNKFLSLYKYDFKAGPFMKLIEEALSGGGFVRTALIALSVLLFTIKNGRWE